MSIDPVSLAITAALTAAQMALTATRKIEGPRLQDLKVSVADYGTGLNYFKGLRRFDANPIIWAEDLREKKRKRKTKGGKYNEYTYYGTWATVVADHEIDAVTRIWFDKHLIYDMTGTGPVTPFNLGVSVDTNIRIYLGTETQEADPRMLATVEAKQGAGSCPAYRGVAYIVFEEIPLEKLGNRIPQQSIEATSGADTPYPWETLIDNHDFSNYTLAGTYGVHPVGGTVYLTDLPSRTLVSTGALPGSIMGGGIGMTSDGSFYALSGVFWDWILWLMNPEGGGTEIVAGGSFTLGPFVEGCAYVGGIVCIYPYTFISPDIMYYDGTTIVVVSNDFIPTHYFEDEDGLAWAVGDMGGGSVGFYQMPHGPLQSVATASSDGQVWAMDNGQGQYFVIKGGSCLVIDKETMTLVSSIAAPSYTQEDCQFAFRNVKIGASSIWIKFNEVSTTTGATLRTVSGSSWAGSGTWGASSRVIYEPINHALVGKSTGTGEVNLRILYLDRATGNGVTLETIVNQVCSLSGMDSGDYDATALTQTVIGFSWTQASGKQIIEPLLDFHDVDPRPHNFQLQFLNRGSAAAGTIDVGEFAVQDRGDRYKVTVTQDTDLPRRLTFSFADPDADQQKNAVVVQRPLDSVDGIRETSYDLGSFVVSVDDARQGAERYFRRLWNGRESYENSLSSERLGLEPADVWNLNLDDIVRTARLDKMTLTAADSLSMTWKQDFPSLALLTTTTGAPQDGREPSVIAIIQPSKTFVLDIPLIRDSDNNVNPILYCGAAPYVDGIWPGAVIYEKDGIGDYSIAVAGIDSTDSATWGVATGVLADASSTVWDRGNSVNISLNQGTLTSATEAACNANPRLNQALLGQEIIQFATATLEMDGSWTLTKIKRGRRGSEWATGLHVIGEQFVMLDHYAIGLLGAGEIGTNLSFKAITNGLDADSSFPVALTPYTAAANRPWAPAQFRATKDPAGSGDWIFTWRRRSRISGDYAPFAPPLGESTESYKLKIYDGSTVVRTITATSETATWTKAQQETDFGGEKWATVTAGVIQVGDLADGYETTDTFHAVAPASNLVFVGGTAAHVGYNTGTNVVDLTSLTGGIAAAPATGDIVIVGMATTGTDEDLSLATSGYTERADICHVSLGPDTNLAVYTKVMGGSPDTDVTVNPSGNFRVPNMVAVHVWRNAQVTTPFDSIVTDSTTGGRNPNPPAIRPLVERSVIICIGANPASNGSEYVGSPTQSGSELSNFIGVGITSGSLINPVAIGMGSIFWDGLGTFDPVQWVGDGLGSSSAAISLAIRST